MTIQSTDSAGATYNETFNVISGSGTGETLPTSGTGLTTDDILYGLNNADIMFGGSGNDTLFGQNGNDALIGGAGADTFKWALSDQGTLASPAIDTVKDFDATANSDKLDLRDLLQGEHTNALSLDAYLDFSYNSTTTTTTINVRPTGTAGDMTQKIVLENFNLSSYAGSGATDSTIITKLLTDGKLIVDL